MRVSIHQPDYLPWIPFFHKIKWADVFVLLDNAQYGKNKYHNRNRVRTAQGWTFLSIPISHSSYGTPICDVSLPPDGAWRRKHLRTIELSYTRAGAFGEYIGFLRELYETSWSRLVDLNERIIRFLSSAFGLEAKIMRSSDLSLDPGLRGTRRLVEIVKTLGGSHYLSGPSGQRYLDVSLFEREGIGIEFQEYVPCTYRQLHGEFIPGLSAIDLLLNEGGRRGGDFI